MSARRAGALALLILAAGLAAGCTPIAWTRVTLNNPIDAGDVAFITPGKTNLDEVINALGVPSELSRAPDGFVANYYYYDGRRFSVEF